MRTRRVLTEGGRTRMAGKNHVEKYKKAVTLGFHGNDKPTKARSSLKVQTRSKQSLPSLNNLEKKLLQFFTFIEKMIRLETGYAKLIVITACPTVLALHSKPLPFKVKWIRMDNLFFKEVNLRIEFCNRPSHKTFFLNI